MYIRPRTQTNNHSRKKRKIIYLVVSWFVSFVQTPEWCMSINSYAVLVHIEDSPVCGDFFLGSVVRIMLPTPYTRHAHYDWGFLRSDTIYTLFHTRRIDRKFRQDGRYPSNCSCRCATPVAKPLTMDKTVYIFGLSETVSKITKAWKHRQCSWRQNFSWVLFIICCGGAARVLGTCLVKNMKILIPLISVCHGTDYSFILLYRAKRWSIQGRWALMSSYKQTSDRRIHTARTRVKLEKETWRQI